MAGSVLEWCADWSREGETRRLRGGAWYDSADFARSAHRNDDTPDTANNNVGFRYVVVPHSLSGPECRTSTEGRRVHDGRARGT